LVEGSEDGGVDKGEMMDGKGDKDGVDDGEVNTEVIDEGGGEEVNIEEAGAGGYEDGIGKKEGGRKLCCKEDILNWEEGMEKGNGCMCGGVEYEELSTKRGWFALLCCLMSISCDFIKGTDCLLAEDEELEEKEAWVLSISVGRGGSFMETIFLGLLEDSTL
jgi:hypothetical protein